jgi:hypothetical protein
MESRKFSIRGMKCWVFRVYRNLCEKAALLPFGEMMEGILDRVDAWRKGPPSDDVSLVLVAVN